MFEEFSVGLGFSWSLNVLCRGLRRKIGRFVIKKIYLAHRNLCLDPDVDSGKKFWILNGFSESGSEPRHRL